MFNTLNLSSIPINSRNIKRVSSGYNSGNVLRSSASLDEPIREKSFGCDVLSGPPRPSFSTPINDTQNVSYPMERQECPKWKYDAYEKGNCYSLYSLDQGVEGIVCGDSGGNDEWTRGNQFGVPYNWNDIHAKPQMYSKEPERRAGSSQVNILANNPFYHRDRYRTDNVLAPKHKYRTGSYPHFRNTSEINDQPYFRYPYEVLPPNAKETVREDFSMEDITKLENYKVYKLSGLLVIFFVLLKYIK